MFRSATRAIRPVLTTTSRPLSTTCIRRSSNWKAASSTSDSSKQASHGSKKVNPNVPTILLENRCAFVRTWDFLRNPAEALALVRAVEQKYGPVENFLFQRDFDSPSVYQAQVKITFEDVESFHRIPEDFETLHIRAPKVEPKRPGGIGLDEIQHFISEDVEFLTADQVSEIAGEERTIDFRIERAKRPYFEESPHRPIALSHHYRREIGTKMLEWGGFHEMKPIESTRSITNEELTQESMDHVYMRRTLREWARYLKVRNPYEVYPEEKEQQDVKSVGSKSKEIREPISTMTTEQNSGRTKSPSSSDEWTTRTTPQARTIREPIEQLLEMEDIMVTTKVPINPQEEVLRLQDALTKAPSSSSEAEVPSGEPTIPKSPPPQPQQSDRLLETQPTSAADSTTTSADSPLRTGQLIPPDPQFPGAVEAEPPSRLQPLFRSKPSKSEVHHQDLEVRFEEAARPEDLVESYKGSNLGVKQEESNAARPQEGAKLKVPPKNAAGKEGTKEESSSSGLEQNPRFESFFNRLQDLLKKP